MLWHSCIIAVHEDEGKVTAFLVNRMHNEVIIPVRCDYLVVNRKLIILTVGAETFYYPLYEYRLAGTTY